MLAYQGRADEGELIIRGKNRQVDYGVDDIIDGTNNDESTGVSANQACIYHFNYLFFFRSGLIRYFFLLRSVVNHIDSCNGRGGGQNNLIIN